LKRNSGSDAIGRRAAKRPLSLRMRRLLRDEWRQLVTILPSDRPWQMPFAATLASGLPLLVGAWFNQMSLATLASLGGLVFLYMPETPLAQRMVMLMACAFGMIASFALGALAQLQPALIMPALTVVAILVTMVCRFYRVGPPGSLFFIMAASIAAWAPGDLHEVPQKVGAVAMGCSQAALVAFLYSLFILRRRPPRTPPGLAKPEFGFVVYDAVLIGLFVGMSLLLAQLLELEKPYWVPVSCLAVIQGMNLRAVWNRQVHRIVGTSIGLLLAWGLLALELNAWGMALAMMALTFIVEVAVVRHYGFAAIFITPLTLLLAEAATMGQSPPAMLMQARLVDTVVGCMVGLAGGACLHSLRLRAVLLPRLRRMLGQ
jgi:uncharacterized membrane protein YccC